MEKGLERDEGATLNRVNRDGFPDEMPLCRDINKEKD